ncbi:MAG: hypothetical protein L3K16_03955 [Thermoplasmata archaeon]|nr:hypothetical protein [Thermoplasmata archaeon]
MARAARGSEALLALGDVPLFKQRTKSAGVRRQYGGAIGAVGNGHSLVGVVYLLPGDGDPRETSG